MFDLETNGLVFECTLIHCLAIYDLETDTTYEYNDRGNCEPIVRGIQVLEAADMIIGHNIIGYDIPVIKKFYPWFTPPDKVIDTLILSRILHTNLLDIDKRHKWKHMPLQLYGRHSLEAYGHRLGEYKGDFSKTTDWKEWSEEMQQYCVQDTVVTKKLCEHFHPYLSI